MGGHRDYSPHVPKNLAMPLVNFTLWLIGSERFGEKFLVPTRIKTELLVVQPII
jgi:hypothetical protein